MAGLGFKLTVKDLSGFKRLEKIRDAFTGGAVKQALNDCGIQLMRSVEKNFQAGGRPVKWQAPKPSTMRQKRKTRHTKTLIDSGILKNSITKEVAGNTLTVGTTVPYAKIHQFGGDIQQAARRQTLAFSKGRFYSREKASACKKKTVDVRFASIGARTLHIPARPFLLIQDADIKVFKQIFRVKLLK
jgi:phage virion morphogenesis protein